MPEFAFKGKKYNNPVELSLDVIGGKWKMPILWRLKEDAKRYGELRKSLPKVTHKMLTQQLRELEQDEIITRKVYPEVPPKVEYSLTLLGKSVIPVIDMLREWGEEYRSVFEK
jgi:DNA-binding HxlR family transcriptional regulator